MSHKKPSKPAAWKNTYFWIAGILLIIAIYGLDFAGKEDSIRDPGQKREGGLVWFYFAASILMVVNGVISHRQTVRHYEETVGPLAPTRDEPRTLEQVQSETAADVVEEGEQKENLHG